jgi:hypothetical protein
MNLLKRISRLARPRVRPEHARVTFNTLLEATSVRTISAVVKVNRALSHCRHQHRFNLTMALFNAFVVSKAGRKSTASEAVVLFDELFETLGGRELLYMINEHRTHFEVWSVCPHCKEMQDVARINFGLPCACDRILTVSAPRAELVVPYLDAFRAIRDGEVRVVTDTVRHLTLV